MVMATAIGPTVDCAKAKTEIRPAAAAASITLSGALFPILDIEADTKCPARGLRTISESARLAAKELLSDAIGKSLATLDRSFERSWHKST